MLVVLELGSELLLDDVGNMENRLSGGGNTAQEREFLRVESRVVTIDAGVKDDVDHVFASGAEYEAARPGEPELGGVRAQTRRRGADPAVGRRCWRRCVWAWGDEPSFYPLER